MELNNAAFVAYERLYVYATKIKGFPLEFLKEEILQSIFELRYLKNLLTKDEEKFRSYIEELRRNLSAEAKKKTNDLNEAANKPENEQNAETLKAQARGILQMEEDRHENAKKIADEFFQPLVLKTQLLQEKFELLLTLSN